MAPYKIYMYVVDRDFGFAPNPFHGFCSLATCKPTIRNSAQVGDWVIGVGGARLRASGRCIFAMRVSDKLTFNEYWANAEYRDKKPVRNGSSKMLVGDNVYNFDPAVQEWQQASSHHSNVDGSCNRKNLSTDTKSRYVLLSRHFFYFGSAAPEMPASILKNMGYTNGIGHRVFKQNTALSLIDWIETTFGNRLNQVVADPFDFDRSDKHYSGIGSKII